MFLDVIAESESTRLSGIEERKSLFCICFRNENLHRA